MRLRKRIYEVIEVAREDDRLSACYDAFMIAVILISLLPLLFKEITPLLHLLDRGAMFVFIADYLLRWSTADYKYQRQSASSFLRYPFSFMALVDLLSILPSLTILNSGFKVLRLLRMMRALRVFRVLKVVRYSKSIRIIGSVLRNSRESLAAVGSLAIAYIVVSALVVFNAEPDSFRNFFEALYWSTVLLTTVGFGDITPVTTIGRLIAMTSSIFGMAIVALPSGIITAGYMQELYKDRDKPTRQESVDLEQLERIIEMETRFDRARAALAAGGDAKEDLAALAAYYDGGDWRRDYEADEAGLLPPALKRGVLSQDGLYDLLTEAAQPDGAEKEV